MKVVVAPDKFRGSLSAPEAARAIARGVKRVAPDSTIDEIPMADGGEGTVDALVAATSGKIKPCQVTDPIGRPVLAMYGTLGDGITAVIEMASASGLALIPVDRRNPALTSTRGTGELLAQAIAAGARRVILGIGGSATNDGGAGFAQALGYRLLDRQGREISPGGAALAELDRIERPEDDGRLDGVEVEVACDVDNLLCGPQGASTVYGPQKGADAAMIAILDRNLERFATIIERDLGVSVRDLPGAGAAGGLGAGLVAFVRGRLQPGITLVIRTVGLEARLADADLCLTGEGAIDASSAYGKTAVGVARCARSLNCPVLALAGTLGTGAEDVLSQGIDAVFSLCPGPISLQEAVNRAAELLENASSQVFRAFLAGRTGKRRWH